MTRELAREAGCAALFPSPPQSSCCRAATRPPGFPQNLAAGDIDGDGRNDLVMVNLTMQNATEILVFLQSKTGTFPTYAVYPNPQSTFALTVADVSNDGRADVLTSDIGGQLQVWTGKADGTLAPVAKYSTNHGTAGCGGALVADFTGDGLPDALCPGVFLFPQTRSGTLGPVQYLATVGQPPYAFGDLHGNGFPDLVGEDFYQNVVTLSITPFVAWSMLGLPYSAPLDGIDSGGNMAIGDVTGDGLDDVVIAHSANNPDARVLVAASAREGRFPERSRTRRSTCRRRSPSGTSTWTVATTSSSSMRAGSASASTCNEPTARSRTRSCSRRFTARTCSRAPISTETGSRISRPRTRASSSSSPTRIDPHAPHLVLFSFAAQWAKFTVPAPWRVMALGGDFRHPADNHCLLSRTGAIIVAPQACMPARNIVVEAIPTGGMCP